MGQVTVKTVPPANSYRDCLRRCRKCRIGATNAKNPAKVRFLRAETPPEAAAPEARKAQEPALPPEAASPEGPPAAGAEETPRPSEPTPEPPGGDPVK